MQEDAQFENSQMIGGQANCNECGMNCRTMHNFKIRKWQDSKSIAINVERDAGQCTIWKFTNNGESIAMNVERDVGQLTNY